MSERAITNADFQKASKKLEDEFRPVWQKKFGHSWTKDRIGHVWAMIELLRRELFGEPQA